MFDNVRKVTKTLKTPRSVVLNRRSTSAFLLVRNNLFQSYPLRRPYEFKSITISKEY